MVHSHAVGSPLMVRSMLEAWVELARDPGEETDLPRVSGVRQCSASCRLQIAVPAKLLDCRLQGQSGRTLIHMTYFDNTGNVRVQCPPTLESQMLAVVQKLEKLYKEFATNEEPRVIDAPPDGAALATSSFRHPASSETLRLEKEIQGQVNDHTESAIVPVSTHVPEDEAFQTAVQRLATFGSRELRGYPSWHAKFLGHLRTEFGFHPDDPGEWSLA